MASRGGGRCSRGRTKLRWENSPENDVRRAGPNNHEWVTFAEEHGARARAGSKSREQEHGARAGSKSMEQEQGARAWSKSREQEHGARAGSKSMEQEQGARAGSKSREQEQGGMEGTLMEATNVTCSPPSRMGSRGGS